MVKHVVTTEITTISVVIKTIIYLCFAGDAVAQTSIARSVTGRAGLTDGRSNARGWFLRGQSTVRELQSRAVGQLFGRHR